jgi:hypothetical protein
VSDKRKEERKRLMAFTPVYALNPRVLLGYVEDLNSLGAMVISEMPMEPNTSLTLEIDFPDDVPEVPNHRMRLPVRVAWCRDENNHRYYDIGFEFTDLKPDDKEVIEVILKRFEFRHEFPH